MIFSPLAVGQVIRIGLVGIGFAAQLRADAIAADSRSQLIGVVGHEPEKTAQFCSPLGADAYDSWQGLIALPDLDLVVVSNMSCDHGDIVEGALLAGKHVVVEYPLSLDLAQAERLVVLARDAGLLLHVEHIELLGGLHQATKAQLPAVGQPYYVRYCTLNPQRPAPKKWTYQPSRFGFPLMGALSRIHRLIDLFGTVETVACQNRYDGEAESSDQYTTCLCTAQLRFTSGLLAEVTYGKGEAIWTSARHMEIHGSQGGLVFEGDQGRLTTPSGEQLIEVGSRRGLFAKDTTAVLDALTQGTPLYVTPEASLYALRVADAARRSAETGEVVRV
ncbi:MAG TPA: Gfo/Idh/MocA family oxidoreductase [Leptolyngbyaceae cyanobacterium]